MPVPRASCILIMVPLAACRAGCGTSGTSGSSPSRSRTPEVPPARSLARGSTGDSFAPLRRY